MKAKYCLKLQTNQPVSTVKYTCNKCDKSFNMKHHLNNHSKICKANNKIKSLEHANRELEQKLHTLEIENERVKAEIYEKLARENAERLQKIAEQPRIQTNNTTKISNRLQLMTPFDLDSERTDQYIKNTIDEKYTRLHLLEGTKGLAKFTAENILKDTSGDNMYICTDVSRSNFKFKDDFGEVRKDAKANKLTSMVLPKVMPRVSELVQNEADETQLMIQQKGLEVRGIGDDNTAFRAELGALVTRLPGGVIPQRVLPSAPNT